MKSYIKYIILSVALAGIATSCAMKEDLLLTNPELEAGTKLFVASVENFSRHDVTTKASTSGIAEDHISNLTVFLFGDIDGEMKLLTGTPLKTDGKKLSYIIRSSYDEATETLKYELYNLQETNKRLPINNNNINALKNCRIYIVANMQIDNNITTEQALLEQSYSLQSEGYLTSSNPGIPKNGIPMMGYKDIDITANSETSTTVPLEKLFTKVNFKIRVDMEAGGPSGVQKPFEPFFEPHSWKVYNIPTQITLKEDIQGENGTYNTTEELSNFKYNLSGSQGAGKIYDDATQQDYISFSFYMPEHKVTPYKNASSLNIPESEKHLRQCYKPTFCIDESEETLFPTYVEIIGAFSDHQGHLSQVTYKLYLGQNEIDDFNVIRNQELNNTVVITGITNHDDARGENVSVDHRVHIDSRGYSIALERETLLDSHYEIRPMKITVTEGDKVVVTIPHQYQSWFGAEYVKDNTIGDELYDPKKQGLRRYFTNNLIDELWGKRSSTATVTTDKTFVFEAEPDGEEDEDGVETFTLWFYFDENIDNLYNDENPGESDPLFREGQIAVQYFDPDGEYEDQTQYYIFRQMSLWAIDAEVNDYYIEYFEEYLYNYASDESYGEIEDGMEWGLVGETLSTKYQAVYVDKSDMGGFGEWFAGIFGGTNQGDFNNAFADLEQKYDFYLSRDNMNKPRDYAGLDFTKEISNIESTKILDGSVTLSKDARSAVEYCYNKNKRNSDGLVDEIKWYLPAIDETEDILVAGYNYFPVFQSKYYWSSQPAYDRYSFTAREGGIIFGTSANGYFYGDNVQHARATIVTESKTGENSGVEGTKGSYNIRIDDKGEGTIKLASNEDTQTPQNGYKNRGDKLRIRCAYSKSPHIYGDYNVKLATNSEGTQGIKDINVTLHGYYSDNPNEQYNVTLSNSLHPNYTSTNFPQKATYDKESGILTIPMSQRINDGTIFFFVGLDAFSILYNGNYAYESQDQYLRLRYNKSTMSFEPVNTNDNIRYKNTVDGTSGYSGYYIQSFTRETTN